MDKEIAERVGHAIEERVFPGCVVGFVRANGTREILAFGRHANRDDAPLVTPDSVYDLASVTKSIPVATLALLYISEKKMSLDSRVAEYLPELQNHNDATIEDLLRYRVRGARMSTLGYSTFEEIRTHVLERGFDAPPGEPVYTNLPAFVLGMVLERVGNASLEKQGHQSVFEPLQMTNTTYFPSATVCVPTEIDDRGEVRGLPHDESAYVFAKERRSVGHAGLFSTAPDLLNFLEALLTGDFRQVVDAAQNGLGWQRRDDMALGQYASEVAFGKTGFTGTSVAVDKKCGVGLVILSNRTYPKRPQNMTAINQFRSDIGDIVLAQCP